MNLTKRCSWAKALLVIGIVGALSSCGGGGDEDVISVSISPQSADCEVSESCSFTATVSGTANQTVTWSLSGDGCTGASCGTISTEGLYTAPAVVPVPPTVTVAATSQADTSKLATATLTIVSDVAVAVWPAIAKVRINDTYQFSHTLTGSGDTSVTWSLSATGCTDAECGTIDSSGRYTAPGVVPVGATVNVRVTSVVDPGKYADASVVIGATWESRLSGSYAYFYQGVWNNSPGHLAGRFMADGAGGISNGVFDRTVDASLGGNLIGYPNTGSYLMWTPTRGQWALAFEHGSVFWMLSLTTGGDNGFFQPFYDPNVRGIAVLMKQNPTAFTASAVSGDYVFLWNGSDSEGNRIAEIGRFSADGAGLITGGELDLNDGSELTEGISIDGSYTVSTNGRGTMELTMEDLGTFEFAIYVVSAETLIATSIDDPGPNIPMLIGLAQRQSGGPFSAASLQGTHVFELTGRRSSAAAVATAGLATSDGAGNLMGLFDRNDDNVVTTEESYTANYSISSDGRGTIESAELPAMVFYMARPDLVLLMEGPGGAVQTGTMESQAGVPFGAGTLVGQYAQASSPPALFPSVTVTAEVFYSSSGDFSAVGDIASPCSLVSSGPTSGPFTVSSSGRFDLVDPGGGRAAGGYMLSPLRYVLVLERPSSDPSCDEIVHLYRALR
jgi:hypothetical protein